MDINVITDFVYNLKYNKNPAIEKVCSNKYFCLLIKNPTGDSLNHSVIKRKPQALTISFEFSFQRLFQSCKLSFPEQNQNS